MWNFLKNDRVQWSLTALIPVFGIIVSSSAGMRILFALLLIQCLVQGFVTSKRWLLWFKIILTVGGTTILILILTKIL